MNRLLLLQQSHEIVYWNCPGKWCQRLSIDLYRQLISETVLTRFVRTIDFGDCIDWNCSNNSCPVLSNNWICPDNRLQETVHQLEFSEQLMSGTFNQLELSRQMIWDCINWNCPDKGSRRLFISWNCPVNCFHRLSITWNCLTNWCDAHELELLGQLLWESVH